MRRLCAFLSNAGGYGRTVIDESGIAGAIDFGMESTRSIADGAEQTASAIETFDEAIRDQLGVKLTQRRAVLDIPIVDRVSASKEN